jgi:hypothetical protein
MSSSALIAIYLLTKRVVGSWSVGIVALLALAAAAPFRLLGDAFGYQSYDFAAKIWTLLFISLSTLQTGRLRLIWSVVAGISAFLTMALIGFEMVVAIAAYSILFPLLFAPSRRHWTILLPSICVGTGLVAGMISRLAHNVCMLGSLEAVVTDFVATFLYRSSASVVVVGQESFSPDELSLGFISFLTLLRFLNYYLPHSILIFSLVIGALVFRFSKSANKAWDHTPMRPIVIWLVLIFVCESLWFLIFRQHTRIHTHTIYHLALSASLMSAVAVTSMWRVVGRSPTDRYAVSLVMLIIFGMGMANLGVRSVQNVEVRHDWSQQQQEVAALAAALPADAIVVLDHMDIVTAFFLDRTYLFRSPPEVTAVGRPRYAVKQRTAKEPMPVTPSGGELLLVTSSYALFRLG